LLQLLLDGEFATEKNPDDIKKCILDYSENLIGTGI
jgi:hypothetical protein